MTAAGPTQAVEAKAPAISEGARRTALGLLFFAYVFSVTDRQIVSILFQPIKAEFGLSDTALGLLGGLAFGVFYATLGLPIARIADKGNRREIVAVSLAIFSAMTALCGMAQSFWQLVLARFGVGIGEAGVNPASHSMIADYYPPAQRSTVMSVLAMGANMGMFIGLIIGGFVSHAYGWRAAFLVVGLPGLILAVLVQMFLKEPQRGLSEGRVAKGDVPPLGQSLGYMWRNRAMRHLIAGSTITGVVTYGLSQWQPAFFMRVHEMPASKVGLTLGLLFGVVGGAGALCGGWLTDKLQNRREAWGIWMIAAVMVVMVPLHVSAFRAQSTAVSLALFMLPVFASSFYLGPSLALVQGLAPLRMRSISAAVKMLCMNLIGLGIGPTVVGVLSDLFEPAYGRDSLRMALIVMSLLPIWAAVHFYFCGRHLKAGLAMALED